jgi:hypothetical protein
VGEERQRQGKWYQEKRRVTDWIYEVCAVIVKKAFLA